MSSESQDFSLGTNSQESSQGSQNSLEFSSSQGSPRSRFKSIEDVRRLGAEAQQRSAKNIEMRRSPDFLDTSPKMTSQEIIERTRLSPPIQKALKTMDDSYYGKDTKGGSRRMILNPIHFEHHVTHHTRVLKALKNKTNKVNKKKRTRGRKQKQPRRRGKRTARRS
jgi:hypothetical protein